MRGATGTPLLPAQESSCHASQMHASNSQVPRKAAELLFSMYPELYVGQLLPFESKSGLLTAD